MSHPRGSIEGMHTASGLQLVIHGNAVEAPARKTRRWPYFILLAVALVAAVRSYLR